MRKLLLLGVACLALLGCATSTPSATGTVSSTVQTAQESLITACGGYAQILNTLTVFKTAGKLSTKIIADVDSANLVAGAICDPTQPLPADLAGATAKVLAVVTSLTADAAGVH